MEENLKQKAAKGIIWKFIEQGGTQLIQFISGIYIARILSPEAYGLVGMLAIFLGISQMFIDSGFRATLIQRGNDLTHDHYNVVFIFNLFISILFFILVYVFAPSISTFYHEPRLTIVARVLGLNLILSSFGIIPQTIFEKKLNFLVISKIRLVSVSISVLVGIILALKGFEVWSLVAMTLVESLLRAILFWKVNVWMPTLQFNVNAFKELFNKGIHIFWAGILQVITINIYSFVIGKFYTVNDVGFYSQGQKLQRRIVDLINGSLQGVMYPVQTLMKGDIPRLKNAVRKNVKFTTLVSFPAAVGLIAIAKPFVLLFLTEKWLPSVFYIQILALSGIFNLLRAPLNSHIMALGKFKIMAFLSLINNVILLAFFIIGIYLKFDLKLLMVGKPVQEFVGLILTIYLSKKYIKYNLSEIITDSFPAFIFSTIMGVTIYYLGFYLQTTYVLFFMLLALAAASYITLNYFFNKHMYTEIIHMVRGWLRK